MRMPLKIDPRTGLILLLISNVIGFAQKPFWVETGWIVFLCVLTVLCACTGAAVKWLLTFALLLVLQFYILPVSAKFVATSFFILANYMRRMLPSLITGTLMVKTIPLRHFVVGLRKLRFPQRLIVAISVTLRYFPAIREEAGHIRDAMKLRDIHGPRKAEFLIVPLMISATGTAEELSAAAVTRGIENPTPKTSVVELRVGALDFICLASALGFIAFTFFLR